MRYAWPALLLHGHHLPPLATFGSSLGCGCIKPLSVCPRRDKLRGPHYLSMAAIHQLLAAILMDANKLAEAQAMALAALSLLREVRSLTRQLAVACQLRIQNLCWRGGCHGTGRAVAAAQGVLLGQRLQ